jgi:hypothetical protein
MTGGDCVGVVTAVPALWVAVEVLARKGRL